LNLLLKPFAPQSRKEGFLFIWRSPPNKKQFIRVLCIFAVKF